MPIPFRLSCCLLGAALTAAMVGDVVAQDYPVKPLRLVVANSAGSPPDIVARIVAPELAGALGQPVVIDNKPGAGSIIGYEFVAKQAADGYTIAVIQVPSLAILPVTAKNLRFDPLRDLTPVIDLAEGRYALVTAASRPWKTFADLVAGAKAAPGRLNYGSSSPLVRLPMEAVVRGLGVQVAYVPYSAAAPYYQGLITDEVQMGLVAESTAISFKEKLRILAVSGTQRASSVPDVPTFRELGYPQIPGLSYSLNVTAGSPRAAITRLAAAASRVLQHPDVKARFAKLQMDILDNGPDAAAKTLAEQGRFLADIAKQVGIQPE